MVFDGGSNGDEMVPSLEKKEKRNRFSPFIIALQGLQ